jgi:hypothetical protein
MVSTMQDIVSQMRSHYLSGLGQFGEALLENLTKCAAARGEEDLRQRMAGNFDDVGFEAQVRSRWHSAFTVQVPGQLTKGTEKAK